MAQKNLQSTMQCIFFFPYLALKSAFASQMVQLGLFFSQRIFPNSYAAECFEPTPVELHQTGTFWTLNQLSYSAAALHNAVH